MLRVNETYGNSTPMAFYSDYEVTNHIYHIYDEKFANADIISLSANDILNFSAQIRTEIKIFKENFKNTRFSDSKYDQQQRKILIYAIELGKAKKEFLSKRIDFLVSQPFQSKL